MAHLLLEVGEAMIVVVQFSETSPRRTRHCRELSHNYRMTPILSGTTFGVSTPIIDSPTSGGHGPPYLR